MTNLFRIFRCLLLAISTGFPFFARSSDPNIILIVVDDLGYGELGSYGGTEIPTPHLDELARAGVRFTDGYVTASYCAPSRAGMLTGRYQTRFGYEKNPVGAQNADPKIGLPAAEETIAEALQDRGYATGLVGKWHLGATPAYHPLRHGFDEFFGFLHEGHYFVPHPWTGTTTWLRRKTLPNQTLGRWHAPDQGIILTDHMNHNEPAYDADNPLLRNSEPVSEDEHLTAAFTREAIDFVERHSARPFFLYLPYNAVHSPLQADNAYLEKFAHISDIHRRIFAAMLAQLDDGVGKLMATLESQQIADQTLVIFLSDNGGATKELTSSNAPLRGGKGSVYEGGVRVPFIMRWPQKIFPNQIYRQPVLSLDIFATALNAAGGSFADSDRPRDGVDLLPFLDGTKSGPPHESLFWRMGSKTAVRLGEWKLTHQSPARGVEPTWQLYNLHDDISESQDLASSEPDRLAELMSVWESYNAAMSDPAW
jgi:arylsulfatase A-like enzyme